MVSRFSHFQNKVLNIDGVKVKLQVRIYVNSQLNTSDTITPQPQLQPKFSVSFLFSSLWLIV